MYCKKCGAQLKKGANFCGSCGAPIDDKEQPTTQNENMSKTVVVEKNVKVEKNAVGTGKPSLLSRIKQQPCLAALIVCAVLWLSTPFVAINIGSLYDGLPNAFQIVTDDIEYIGELQETSVYWAAVISGIGIVTCLFFTVKKRSRASRITMIIAEVPMIMTLIETYDWLGGDGIGIGFWGIFILFLVVFVFSKTKETKETNSAGN